MPSLETYKQLYNGTIGQAHKRESDKIMDFTWWNDIQSRVAYFYDYYHDDHKNQLDNLNSPDDPKKIPIDIKFVQATSQTYNKDPVTFHLQLRPGYQYENDVDYYNDFFKNRYGATFPVGLWCDIPDEQGIYNRWLVVQKANYNVTQFPTFEILRCDHIFQYIIDRRKFEIAGVLQSQNSYNSGLWTNYKITSVEDQQKFAVPLNRDTEKIYYNLRMIIDTGVLTEPRTWEVSKVNRVGAKGILMVTLAQDQFNHNTDFIDSDEFGNVIGMWADYFKDNTVPENALFNESNKPTITISYSGNPSLRIGSGYKKLTVNFTMNNEPSDFMVGQWQYFVGDEDVSDKISYSAIELNENEVKIKFACKDYSYGGKILTVKYVVNAEIQGQTELGLINI